MKTKTLLNHKTRALSKLSEIYSWVEISGMSSSELIGRELEVFNSLKPCPRWLREWLHGWCECRRKMAEQALVFFYTMKDGRLLSTHRNRPDYYEKQGVGPREVYEQATHSGHYWCIKRHDGTEKIVPYFVSEMEH